MKLQTIINALDLTKVDEEEFLQPALRRDLFKKAADFSLKAALASLPFALTAIPKIVKGQSSAAVDVLNFALTLEYLEDEFYRLGLLSGALDLGPYRTMIIQISKHELAHVNLLKGALGTAAVAKPTFDFTAQGAFPDWNTNRTTFLALSQAFEDAGERAYKGQAANLINDGAILQTALQIHSVEARHAAAIRHVRGIELATEIRPWKTAALADGLPAAIYAGEDNTIQGGVNITTLGINGAASSSFSEAFDEPLTRPAVEAIVAPFIV